MKNVKNRTRSATLALLLAAAITPQALLAQSGAGQPPCQVAQRESLPDTIARVELGVVVVWTHDKDGKSTGHGSGFFIDATGVVTNYHVLEGAASARVVLANGRSYPVKTVNATDMRNDLVVIEVDIPKDAGHRPLALHTAQPRKGQEVWVLGAPHGLEFSLSSGIVSAVRPMPDMTTNKIIQIDASSSPGSSGGPVINRCGEVIGVSSFGMSEGQNLNFAQGAWNIQAIAPHPPKTIQIWADEQARALYEQALADIRQGNDGRALDKIIRLLENDPDHPQAWFVLGDIMVQREDYPNAIKAYGQHLRTGIRGREAARTLVRIAAVLAQDGKPELSERTLMVALEEDARYRPALVFLGDLKYGQKDWQNAADAYARALRIEPQDQRTRARLSAAVNNTGVALAHDKRLGEALATFQRALAIWPENEHVMANLGTVAHELGESQIFQDMHDRLIARNSELAPSLARFLPK